MFFSILCTLIESFEAKMVVLAIFEQIELITLGNVTFFPFYKSFLIWEFRPFLANLWPFYCKYPWIDVQDYTRLYYKRSKKAIKCASIFIDFLQIGKRIVFDTLAHHREGHNIWNNFLLLSGCNGT